MNTETHTLAADESSRKSNVEFALRKASGW